MSEIGKRIKEIRTEQRLTQREFAGKIFIKQGFLSNIERGKRRPSKMMLLAIQNVFNVRKEWLLTGKGSKRGINLDSALELIKGFNKEEREEFERMILKSKAFDGLMAAGPETLRIPRPIPDLKVISRRELDNLERHEAFVPVPLVSGAVAAGSPRIVEDHDIEGYCLIYQSWCKRPEDYVCVRVAGDSMEPALPDGSIVAVHLKARSPKRLEKKLVAARHGDGVVVKELQCSESKKEWFLISFNKEYPPLLIRPEEEENPIIGKVAWWWARQE